MQLTIMKCQLSLHLFTVYYGLFYILFSKYMSSFLNRFIAWCNFPNNPSMPRFLKKRNI